MARVLRWGAGYGGEDPHHILVSVDEADEVLMDRWTILLDAQDISEDGKENGFLEPPKVRKISKCIHDVNQLFQNVPLPVMLWF